MNHDDIRPATEETGAERREAERRSRSTVEADMSVHGFGVSAGLVGVCLTVVGIIRIGINLKPGFNTIADEILAVDSVCFLAAPLLAYTSLRTPVRERAKQLESYTDRLFIAGMATLCVACALVAFSLL